MTKYEVNWETEIVPPPEVLFKAEIEEEIARLDKVITEADSGAREYGRQLQTLSGAASAGLYFVKTTALLHVFNEQGVLDTYYDCYNRRSKTYRDTETGWVQLLRLPRGKKGAFEITYEAANSRQTVRYFPSGK